MGLLVLRDGGKKLVDTRTKDQVAMPKIKLKTVGCKGAGQEDSEEWHLAKGI